MATGSFSEKEKAKTCWPLARAADLVIYAQGSAEYRLPTGFAPEDLVVAAGRPMLIAPYAGNSPRSDGARWWPGTARARRLARRMTRCRCSRRRNLSRCLRSARTRPISSAIGPGSNACVTNYERHGIAVRVEETIRSDLGVGDVLLSRAGDFDADLIVAGAYHHSQLRESLFGGVTRDLLDRMTVPVLMSH